MSKEKCLERKRNRKKEMKGKQNSRQSARWSATPDPPSWFCKKEIVKGAAATKGLITYDCADEKHGISFYLGAEVQILQAAA